MERQRRPARTGAVDRLGCGGRHLQSGHSLEAAQQLAPIFTEHNGRNGRLSMQTDPRLARSPKALADQAEYFASLAPNIIVKIPATATGVEAIEDAVARGVNINVTVSFSVPQALGRSPRRLAQGPRRPWSGRE